ncbi:hypothetical protein niasHS_005951 [Heterodera schachtii]|uniref:Uncharacterized protein n=1 Tax=Heterodera schachtii TaxID=97005 RepID=A0ABD2JMZ7_HETSC
MKQQVGSTSLTNYHGPNVQSGQSVHQTPHMQTESQMLQIGPETGQMENIGPINLNSPSRQLQNQQQLQYQQQPLLSMPNAFSGNSLQAEFLNTQQQFNIINSPEPSAITAQKKKGKSKLSADQSHANTGSSSGQTPMGFYVPPKREKKQQPSFSSSVSCLHSFLKWI